MFGCGPALAGMAETQQIVYRANGDSSVYRLNSGALMQHADAAMLLKIRNHVGASDEPRRGHDHGFSLMAN